MRAGGHGGHNGLDESPSPFNLQSILAFVTFFGGVGYALTLPGELTRWVVFAVAVLGGLAGGALIYLFLAKVLYAHQTPYLSVADSDLTGSIARVSSSILAGGAGEIVVRKAGRQRVEGARSSVAIPRGQEVVIVGYERGMATVEPLDI